MTLSEALATPIKHRRSSRAAALRRAPLEELVTEVQCALDAQLTDHAAQSASIITERGRDAVEDRSFMSALANVRFQISHGTKATQLAALDRLHRCWIRDETAEDRFLGGLLSELGVHQVDAMALRRLVRANAPAIVRGEPVVLDDDVPQSLIDRQKAARS